MFYCIARILLPHDVLSISRLVHLANETMGDEPHTPPNNCRMTNEEMLKETSHAVRLAPISLLLLQIEYTFVMVSL